MAEMPTDMVAHNRKVIEDFRANGAPEGRALLLLTTTGARTGQRRTTPLMYVRTGERLLVIAANAGSVRHPDWYHNLVADPEVTVEVGAESYSATAAVTSGADREEVFERIVASHPFFAEYQAKVQREIPVVELVRHD